MLESLGDRLGVEWLARRPAEDQVSMAPSLPDRQPPFELGSAVVAENTKRLDVESDCPAAMVRLRALPEDELVAHGRQLLTH